LKEIVGQLQNTNDELSQIKDELEEQRSLIAKLK
jgi:hypothetical protein